MNDALSSSLLTSGQHQACPASAHSSGLLQMKTGLPDTSVPPLLIGQRLQNLAMVIGATDKPTRTHQIPTIQVPPVYARLLNMDGSQACPTNG